MKESAASSRKRVGRTAYHRPNSSTSRASSTHKSSLHVCPHCRRAFPFSVALHLHIKDHLVQNSFKCSLCTATFSSKYQLSVHLRKHAGLDLYKCNQCSVKFINASNMQRHIRNGVCHKWELVHKEHETRETDFTRAVSVDTLTSDVKKESYNETLLRPNLLSCKACNETFSSLEDFSHHEDLHKTGNIFTCRKCSKNFCTLPRLSGETLGEDEKYWRNKCMLCGATCHSDNDLFIHLQRHLDNNEDLYCKLCQSSRSDLDPKEKNIASIMVNDKPEDITSDKLIEKATVPYIPSLTSNCVSSPTTALPSCTFGNLTGPPLTCSQAAPFQTTTYFTTNLNNVTNFMGAIYHQPDFNPSQQPVCSMVRAPCSLDTNLDLCSAGTTSQTPSVLSTTASGVFMVNPALRRSNSTKSFPCNAQTLSSVPVESGVLVKSGVPTSLPLLSNVAVTQRNLPSFNETASQNIVSCLTANTAAVSTPSVNCYSNQMFPC